MPWGLLGGLAASLLPQLIGMNTMRKQRQNQNRLIDEQRALIGQAREKAGISPEARALQMARNREALRAGQAQRGMFESGVGSAQEAELTPMWEQQMRDYEVNQLMNLARGYQGIGGGGLTDSLSGMVQTATPYAGALGMYAGGMNPFTGEATESGGLPGVLKSWWGK